MDNKLSTRGLSGACLVGLGVVGQTASVGNSVKDHSRGVMLLLRK